MKTLSLVSSALWLSASIILSGCGGGGGGSGSAPTPASNAASSSPVVASSSAAASAQLTIQGTAAAAALAGGEVVFTIGAQTFRAPITDSLKYSIALNVPAQDLNTPFVAVATGNGSDSWVQLAASYPSIATLVAKAGSDKILNADEFFGVNITTLTTAQYAEITANASALATDAERKSAMLESHPIRALEKAAMVSRILADINVDLPEPATTTLTFLKDQNLSETYYEIARLSDFAGLNARINVMPFETDVTRVSTAKLSGVYFLEALNSNYELTFNDDGSGHLRTGSLYGIFYDRDGMNAIAKNFSWVRKGRTIKIQFPQPVIYTTDAYYIDGDYSNHYTCDSYFVLDAEPCEINFDSIELDLISETEFALLSELRITGNITQNGASLHRGDLSTEFARLTSVENAVAITAADLIGFEWFVDQYRYVFMAGGAAKKIDLGDRTEYSVNWEIKNGHVQIDDVSLWPVTKTAVGYTLFYVDATQINYTLMVKRTPVVMTEADWVGRWTGSPLNMFANAHDVNANKTWADGFEAAVAGSWSIIDDHSYTALSNDVWKMNRDVLAIHDGKYYISQCQGVYTPQEENPLLGCFVTVITRAENFDTNVFWGNWSNPAFSEKVGGSAWTLINDRLFYTDDTQQLIRVPYTRVSANKLFNDENETILEMTSASKNEIVLCEYKLNKSCAEVDKRTYEKGVQIKLTVNSEYGDVFIQHDSNDGMYERYIDKALMLPKNRSRVLRLDPRSGYTLTSSDISGCNGTFGGSYYEIPALTTDCEISVNFRAMP